MSTTLGWELQNAGLTASRSLEVANTLENADLSWIDLVNSYRRGGSVEVREDIGDLKLNPGTIT